MLRPSFADKFRIRPTAYGFFHKYSGRNLETVLNFSKKFFLGLMYPFSCVLWAINSKQLLRNCFESLFKFSDKVIFSPCR